MTVDIKSTYGAVGDGKLQTLTVSYSSVTNPTHLIVFSNTFSNAVDAGKKIAVQDWVAASGGNPAGALLSTIVSVGAFATGQQTLVLDTSAQQSASAVAKAVEWGTDDTGAFTTFATAQAGLSGVVLTIPAGRYCFARNGNGRPIGEKVKGLTINCSGNPTLTDMLGCANGYTFGSALNVLFNDNTAESLIQTVGAGASVLPMVTGADAAKYTANTWAWMSGFDVQGAPSDPPNPQWSEFVFITAVDTIAGTVTISPPLKNSYKSTWPKWDAGGPGTGPPNYTQTTGSSKFSLGGPATLYLINQDWDADHTYNNLNFSSDLTLVNMKGRNMTMNGCVPENFAVNVSQQQNCTINDAGTITTLWEMDKNTENFTLARTTVAHGFRVDSPSPFNVTLDTVTVQTGMSSTTNLTATNCVFPAGISFGPISYGAGDRVNVSNSSFAGQLGIGGVKEPNVTGTGGYSMSGGVITRLKAGGTGAPPQWAVPGHYCFFGSRYNCEGPAFRIVDVYDDGTTLFIVTDQTGGFPSLVGGATQLNIITASPPNFTFTNCTGCDDALSWSAVTPNKPQFSQWNKTYSGNIGAANAAHKIKVTGQGVRVRITVGAGYSAGTLNLDGPTVLAKPGNTEATWAPVVDLTQAGVRTITSGGAVGTLGTDSGLAWPNSGNIWFVDNQLTAAMSGAVGAGSVMLEITTDQGVNIGRFFVCNFQ